MSQHYGKITPFSLTKLLRGRIYRLNTYFSSLGSPCSCRKIKSMCSINISASVPMIRQVLSSCHCYLISFICYLAFYQHTHTDTHTHAHTDTHTHTRTHTHTHGHTHGHTDGGKNIVSPCLRLVETIKTPKGRLYLLI